MLPMRRHICTDGVQTCVFLGTSSISMNPFVVFSLVTFGFVFSVLNCNLQLLVTEQVLCTVAATGCCESFISGFLEQALFSLERNQLQHFSRISCRPNPTRSSDHPVERYGCIFQLLGLCAQNASMAGQRHMLPMSGTVHSYFGLISSQQIASRFQRQHPGHATRAFRQGTLCRPSCSNSDKHCLCRQHHQYMLFCATRFAGTGSSKIVCFICTTTTGKHHICSSISA